MDALVVDKHQAQTVLLWRCKLGAVWASPELLGGMAMRPSLQESGAVDQRAQGAANLTLSLCELYGRTSGPAKRASRSVDPEATGK